MNYSVIRKILQNYIDGGIRHFAIFPFGEIGMIAKKILNTCFGISEELIIDNTLCQYNPQIKSLDYLPMYLEKEEHCTCHIILASRRGDLLRQLEQVWPIERIIKLSLGASGRFSTGALAEDPFYDNRVTVGAFCTFAAGVDAVWNHPLNMVTNHGFIFSQDYNVFACGEGSIDTQRFQLSDFNKKFEIGNDVWLGRNVILTNGVRIGNGVRAAAGAIITKDVPDYAVVAGVPAQIIKYRFTEKQIKMLNEIAWWDWPVEKIRDCYDDFFDIDVFLKKHYPPTQM